MDTEISWTSIRALSFDIYGTLVDQNNGTIDAARGTSLNNYLPRNDTELLEGITKHSRDLEQEKSPMQKSDINAEAFRRYAFDLGIVGEGRVSKEDIDSEANNFGSKMGTFPAFPDSVEALKRLRKHYKLIALSNVDQPSLEGTLTKQLAGNPFDACYIAEDIGSYKPNLKNFHYLLDHAKQDFGIEQSELCHIAQSLPIDHAATRQIDLRSVWIDRYDILGASGKSADDMQAEYKYKLRVRSLADVADIVDRAFSERK